MWGGIHALQTTRVAPSNVQKYHSIISLEASQSFPPVGVVCALVVVWFVAGEPVFFFPFFSISFSENYNLTLLVVSISTLILFFSFFYLYSFVEILFVFNFIIESKFIKYYILQFGSYYLDF